MLGSSAVQGAYEARVYVNDSMSIAVTADTTNQKHNMHLIFVSIKPLH